MSGRKVRYPETVSFVAPRGTKEALRLASMRRKTSEAEMLRFMVRRLLEEPEVVERMDLEEALDLLETKARSGNTQAILRRADMLIRASERAPKEEPASELEGLLGGRAA